MYQIVVILLSFDVRLIFHTLCVHMFMIHRRTIFQKLIFRVVTRSTKHPHNKRYVSKSGLQFYNFEIHFFDIFPKISDVGKAKQKNTAHTFFVKNGKTIKANSESLIIVC
jgi:hypothetical protein